MTPPKNDFVCGVFNESPASCYRQLRLGSQESEGHEAHKNETLSWNYMPEFHSSVAEELNKGMKVDSSSAVLTFHSILWHKIKAESHEMVWL